MIGVKELRLRKEYWMHVQACLVQFHNLSMKKARDYVKRYQKQFPIDSEEPAVELIYHFEPFRLACKITDNRLSVKDFADQYRAILLTAPIGSSQNKKSGSSNLIKLEVSGTATRKTVATRVGVQLPAARGKQAPTKKNVGKAVLAKGADSSNIMVRTVAGKASIAGAAIKKVKTAGRKANGKKDRRTGA